MAEHWVKFEAAHARKIIEENRRSQEGWCDGEFSDQWAKAMEGRLWAYTLISDDNPVACVGLALQPWDKAEAWTLLSDSFKTHKLTIYRFIKAGLNMVFHQGIVRVQATIDPNYPESVKWIESLGFECEGRLKKFGPRHEDYLMYARTN